VAHRCLALEALGMSGGSELNLVWVGTREYVQVDVAEVRSGKAYGKECFWYYGLETIAGANRECRAKCQRHFVRTSILEDKQNPVRDLWSVVEECLPHFGRGLRSKRRRRAEGKGVARGS